MGSILAGCGSEATATNLRFDPNPDTGKGNIQNEVIVTDCGLNPHSWAVDIIQPDTLAQIGRVVTVGIATAWSSVGTPEGMKGVETRVLPDNKLEIVTSTDKPGDSTVINPNKETYSRVVDATTDYSVGISVFRVGNGKVDPNVHVQLDCLPGVGYNNGKGNQIPAVPEQPDQEHAPLLTATGRIGKIITYSFL